MSGRAPGERERQSEGCVPASRMAQARTFSRSKRGFMRYSQRAATLPARHTATHRLNVASVKSCKLWLHRGEEGGDAHAAGRIPMSLRPWHPTLEGGARSGMPSFWRHRHGYAAAKTHLAWPTHCGEQMRKFPERAAPQRPQTRGGARRLELRRGPESESSEGAFSRAKESRS